MWSSDNDYMHLCLKIDQKYVFGKCTVIPFFVPETRSNVWFREMHRYPLFRAWKSIKYMVSGNAPLPCFSHHFSYKMWSAFMQTQQHNKFGPRNKNILWAPSSEFVSSSIPSWLILTAHAQPFRGDRDLAFCLKVPLDSLLVWASSEGSGETARMRRLAWTFAARISDKNQIRLTRPISLVSAPCIICPNEAIVSMLCGFPMLVYPCSCREFIWE